MSTRELEFATLDARGIFDFLHKNDKATQKKVDNATDIGACHLYNTYMGLEKMHQTSLKEVKGKLATVTKEKKAVKNAYKDLVKKFKKMSKDAKKKADEQEKLLKKHGSKDVATQCGSHSSSHTDAHKSSSGSHTLAATSHHDSESGSHSASHSAAPEN